MSIGVLMEKLWLIKAPMTKNSVVVFSELCVRFSAGHDIPKVRQGSSVFPATCTSILQWWLTPTVAIVVIKCAQSGYGGGQIFGLL